MTVRTALPRDPEAIVEVHRLAFGMPEEPRLVELILASEGFVPELSIVAVADGDGTGDGAVVGHVLLSAASLECDDGRMREILVLAPLAVLPEHQGRGIGGALVRKALDEADRLGWPLVVLLGHPTYYPRFGFEPASRFGIRSPTAVRDEAFMAKLLDAYDPAFRGVVRYPPAFADVT